MLLLLLLTAAPDLAELKIDRRQTDGTIVSIIADGLNTAPLFRYETRYDVSTLTGEARAALTLQALQIAKAYVESPEGREMWQRRIKGRFDAVVSRSAQLAADAAYWSTLAKERRVKDPDEAAAAERAEANVAAFKKDRARLDREELSREKATAQPDDAAFKMQLTERITYFLAETKTMPFDAKLTEVKGRKRFADKTLEAKPKWWKFCFRAGPEATKAAREFATAWLTELKTSPSAKLSDDK